MNLEKLKGNKDILVPMVNYLYMDFETGELGESPNDVGYTQNDIDECGKILDKYIDSIIALEEPKSNQDIIQCVENAVKELNDLNEKCNYSILETDQREDLVPYILHIAKSAGLVTDIDDITGKWREW
jgi:hypothetical protein